MGFRDWWQHVRTGRRQSDVFDRSLSSLVSPAPSAHAADWIPNRLLPWGRGVGTRVCAVVPSGFASYARILHPAYGPPPDHYPITWSAVAEVAGWSVHAETQWESVVDAVHKSGRDEPWYEEPNLGWCPTEVMVPLRKILGEHTRTPDEVWFAMWGGFPDVQAVMAGGNAARFELPGREYFLVKGPIQVADRLITSPHWIRIGPSLWWPEDRAWCVATEIDFRWTYVGASTECVEQLEGEPRLEALRTQPEHRGDYESDWSPELRERAGET
jgi:hypothetical protein